MLVIDPESDDDLRHLALIEDIRLQKLLKAAKRPRAHCFLTFVYIVIIEL